MSNDDAHDIVKMFEEGTEIDEALRQAVREEMIRKKKLGLSVVDYRDGKVVWIPPEEIPVDDESDPPVAD
jgi:hypothetical protein